MEIQAVVCFFIDPAVSIVEILHEREKSAMATDDNFVIYSHVISFILRYRISHISLFFDSCFATGMLSITGINAIYVLLWWLELPQQDMVISKHIIFGEFDTTVAGTTIP